MPWFFHYEDYFRDKNYADTIITDTLMGEGKWGERSGPQKFEMITITAQYQLMYMAVLVCLQMAQESCANNDIQMSQMMWDQAAGYIIGSLEGSHDGGAPLQDGQLIWNLSNSVCDQFGRCNSNGYSLVASDLKDMLFAGKGEIVSGSCLNLQQTSLKVQHLMLIPIIQSIIRYAINYEDHSIQTSSADIAAGEAFSLCILPLLVVFAVESVKTIEKNMITRDGSQPSFTSAIDVGHAFFPLLEDFDIKCKYVGAVHRVDTCVDRRDRSSASLNRNSISISDLIVVALGFAVINNAAF